MSETQTSDQEITPDNISMDSTPVEEVTEPSEAEINSEVDKLMSHLEEKEFTGSEYTEEEKKHLEPKDAKQASKEPEEDEEEVEGSVVDVPVGPIIEFKVKGEKREMSLEELQKEHPEVLEDLKSGVSSQVRAKELQSALDKEKKEFYNVKKEFLAEKESIEQYIKQTQEKLQHGDIETSIKVLAELGGVPFHQYRAQLLQYALPILVSQQEMTPEQIRIQELEEERAYRLEQEESRSQRAQAEKTRADLIASITEVREAHKIEDDEWDEALIQADQEFKDLQVEDVVSVVMRNRAHNKAQDVISQLDEFPKESVDALRDIAVQNPDFDKETLLEIAKEALAKISAQKQSESMEKEVVQKLGKKLKPAPKQEKEESEVLQSEVDALISKYLN